MAIDLTQLHDTPFALLVWLIQVGKEAEAKVFRRTATWDAETNTVRVYENDSWDLVLILKDEQLDRIQVVTEELKEVLLNCEYGITLTLTDLPDEETVRDYNKKRIRL